MKKTLLLVVSSLLVAASAFCQSANSGLLYYGPTALVSAGTNNIAVTATNTYNLHIDAPRADSLALLLRARPVVSNQVTLNIVMDRSLDGTTFDNVTPYVFVLTGTTNTTCTNFVTLATNVPIGALPYWRLRTIGSTETIAIATNLTFSYGFKR